MRDASDIRVLRDLAKRYRDVAAKPAQDERRDLWRRHFGLERTRPPVIVTYGPWNAWCKEVFSDATMQCQDPFLRDHEAWFRRELFHDAIGDDYICEPWIPLTAVYRTKTGIYGDPWGVSANRMESGEIGGAWKSVPPIAEWSDIVKLSPPPHSVDEPATAERRQRLEDAIGDIVEIDLQRGPVLCEFAGDISTTLAAIRGLEQIMVDMYESPAELHRLLAILRDGILANQAQAEAAGDFSLTTQRNQAMPYAKELEPPRANSGARRRRDLWGFFAAQEYTLISPEFHEEFLLQYQKPIMREWGLVHYGCCEDLTRKIDMLTRISNLRSIAVTPRADVRRCAEQIGRDYVISWRPNPTDMVCAGWDEARIRRILGEGRDACRSGTYHVTLKDVETVQGDTDRLRRWVAIARNVLET